MHSGYHGTDWVSAWVGIPYAALGRGPDAYDCLGLFLALQRERHGRDLPDPRCTLREAVRRRTVEDMRPLFREVERPEEGDALLFLIGGRELHVGYALGGSDMLHVQQDTHSVIEKWTGPRWRSRLRGVYRYETTV